MSWFWKKKVVPVVIPLPPPVKVWRPTAEYQFTSNQIAALVSFAKDHTYMWDSTYWTVSLEDWQKIIADVSKTLPVYLAEKLDCEDFAFLTMTNIAMKYQLNTCGVAVGNSPQGYHGFNVFAAWELDHLVLHILEPQTGQIDPAGYELDTVIFC